MRLDLFLKLSRIVPRRSVAKALCDDGRVSVNGHIARGSRETASGDLIEITRNNRRSVYRIERIPEVKQVSRADARELVSLESEEVIDELIP